MSRAALMSSADALNPGAAPAAPAFTDRSPFAALLQRAISEAGKISEAYRAFHNFSIGNQLLAAMQCGERGLPLGPLATFPGWKVKGRHVRRGERALWLWMPIIVKRTVTTD